MLRPCSTRRRAAATASGPRARDDEEGIDLEIYVSTDVETDGPIPGVYSMLSIGSAAYLPDADQSHGRPHSTFSANLETLPGAAQHPDTMKWWKSQPEAWAACREDLQTPEQAMAAYLVWLKSLPGEPVFVAYPAAFDFMFVCWYLNRFAGENPFGWQALDIKTFAMALTGRDFLDTVKRNMPRNWFDNLPYTHKALDDAISQGALFRNMLAEHKRRLGEKA
ncbi:MAG TPA: 3'-5' exoribonuclease [Pyrinomonadaceae bacterium]